MTIEREAPTVENTNVAPFPFELQEIVRTLRYRPGWTFALEDIDRGQGSKGLTFIVTSLGYNTYAPEQGENYRVHHYMIVPAASYDRRAWLGWVREQLAQIELHELCEFMVVDGQRPFAPNHGPGRNPYEILAVGTVEDAETSFRGTRDEGSQQ